MDLKKHLSIVLLFLFFAPLCEKMNAVSVYPYYSSMTANITSSITTAGDHKESFSNSSQRIYYNIQSSGTYAISASVTSGTIPPGLTVYLEVDPYNYYGGYGTSTGQIQLSSTSQQIVRDLTYTGRWSEYVYLITTIEVTDFGLLHPYSNTVTITYTIAAQ